MHVIFLNNYKTNQNCPIYIYISKRARFFGWPNTYVFTKAMGEMVLGHLRGDLPLVIVRPTIITSILRDPLPGWIEGIRSNQYNSDPYSVHLHGWHLIIYIYIYMHGDVTGAGRLTSS